MLLGVPITQKEEEKEEEVEVIRNKPKLLVDNTGDGSSGEAPWITTIEPGSIIVVDRVGEPLDFLPYFQVISHEDKTTLLAVPGVAGQLLPAHQVRFSKKYRLHEHLGTMKKEEEPKEEDTK